MVDSDQNILQNLYDKEGKCIFFPLNSENSHQDELKERLYFIKDFVEFSKIKINDD